MKEKLEAIEKEYERLGNLLSNPEIMNKKDEFRKYAQEYAGREEIVSLYRKYKKVLKSIAETQEILEEKNKELQDLANEEIKTLNEKKKKLETEIKEKLTPPDIKGEKNVIVEIRAGAGGEEASLFTRDLFKMYSRYAEQQRWKVETMSLHPTGIGGFKEIVFLVEGEKVYKKLKYESGVHRVQRVPFTESGGRIHTSTVTVAVLPEAKEVEVEINPQDLRIDVFKASGPGGQGVNTTDSAVRITHLPSGIIVECQDERSQHKNKTKAMRILRARLLEHLESKQRKEIDQKRKTQVGTGERSEKIRTYNFPQNRVTDHRIGLTLHKLGVVLEGDLDPFIESLSETLTV